MPAIDVDFETYKVIVARRRHEQMSENDVIREALGLADAESIGSSGTHAENWYHKGVEFPVGLSLEHTFRDGRTARAEITSSGIRYAKKVYRELSPAGVAAAGYQVNGWDFWNYKNGDGHWMPVKAMKKA